MKSKRRALEQRVIDEAIRVVNDNPYYDDALTEAVFGLYDLTFDGAPAVGHQSPDTSHTAAKMIAPSVSSIRRQILEEVMLVYTAGTHGGLTCDQVERRLKRPHTTVSSAINWLRDNGWLVDSEMRRMTKAGRPAIVWNPTQRALDQWRNNWRQI